MKQEIEFIGVSLHFNKWESVCYQRWRTGFIQIIFINNISKKKNQESNSYYVDIF